MKIKPIFIILLLLVGLIINPINVFTQTPECAHCGARDDHHATTCPYYGICHQCGVKGGHAKTCPLYKAGNQKSQSSITPEQQMAQGVANFFIGLIFPKKQNTSRQAEIDKQNAIKRQQEEEQKKEAARKAANQAWIDLQNIEQDKRTFDDAKKLEAGEDLLTQMDTVGGGELELKTLGTEDFQGDAVDLRGKQGIVGSLKTSEEQAEFEKLPAAWKENQEELIQQRLKEPNKWCSGIQAHLMGNVPPLPDKTFNELQPGDVLLLEGKEIAWADNKFTSDKAKESAAGHTVIFLKEVNGKKYFLDNQPAPVNWGKGGPRIITDAEFLDRYGHRGAEVARLVGQPLNKEEGDRLLNSALEMAEKNRKKIANNFFGSGYLGTNYGVKGDDMVCSESDWALLNLAREKQIPKSGDQTKVEWGIDWSPADFQNQRYFLVTPLIMPK